MKPLLMKYGQVLDLGRELGWSRRDVASMISSGQIARLANRPANKRRYYLRPSVESALNPEIGLKENA